MINIPEESRTNAEALLDHYNDVFSQLIENNDIEPDILKEAFQVIGQKAHEKFKVIRFDYDKMEASVTMGGPFVINFMAKDIGNDEYEIESEIVVNPFAHLL